MQVFVDNIINVIGMIISLSYRVENIVGKGENAGFHHFLLFPQFFLKPSRASPANFHFCARKFANYQKLGPVGANRGSHEHAVPCTVLSTGS